MSAAEGTINSATPASDLRTEIEDLLTAHSTWELTDTVVTGTANNRVWRCRGSGVANPNSIALDFYVVLTTLPTDPTHLSFRIGEDYVAATDLILRPAPTGGQATQADASAFAATGQTLSTSTIGAVIFNAVVAANENQYYIVVTKNFIAVGLRRQDVSTIYGVYVGAFDSYVEDSTEFPIILVRNTNAQDTFVSTATQAVTSRHPKKISQAGVTGHFGHNLNAAGITSGDTANIDLWHGKGQAVGVELVGQAGSTVPASQAVHGRIRGKLFDVAYYPPASGVTLAPGDTLTIEGEEHYYIPIGDAVFGWVNKVAL
jgi:hypothetical protein